MTNEEAKNTLRQQLELLTEASKTCDSDILPALTHSILELIDRLVSFPQ